MTEEEKKEIGCACKPHLNIVCMLHVDMDAWLINRIIRSTENEETNNEVPGNSAER